MIKINNTDIRYHPSNIIQIVFTAQNMEADKRPADKSEYIYLLALYELLLI